MKTRMTQKRSLNNAARDAREFGHHFFGKQNPEPGPDVDRRTMEKLLVDLDTKSLDEVMDKCGFHYDVMEDKLVGLDSEVRFPHRGMYHSVSKAPLGVVGTSFRQIQPSEAMVAFHEALMARKGKYVAGGYVRNGSRIFVMAEFGQNCEIRKGDVINNQMLLTTAFDGSGSFQMFELPYRYFCANQLAFAIYSQKSFISIAHTTNVKRRMEEFLKGIAIGDTAFVRFQKACERLQKTRLLKDSIDRLCDGLMKPVEVNENEELSGAKLSAHTRQMAIRQEIERLTKEGAGNRGETLYDAYNGVTEWITHHRGQDDDRMESVLFGSGRRMSERALTVALGMAK